MATVLLRRFIMNKYVILDSVPRGGDLILPQILLIIVEGLRTNFGILCVLKLPVI